MMDPVKAMLGKRFCPWCSDHGTTWWERLMHFDVLGGKDGRPFWERAAMDLQDFFTEKVQIWKLGHRWHWKFHVPEDGFVKTKERWIKSIKVGDTVCDCKGYHGVVVEKYGMDDVVLDDGQSCSLFHCCGPVEDDDSCHGPPPCEHEFRVEGDDNYEPYHLVCELCDEDQGGPFGPAT